MKNLKFILKQDVNDLIEDAFTITIGTPIDELTQIEKNVIVMMALRECYNNINEPFASNIPIFERYLKIK